VESVASMLLHKSQQLLITPLSCLLYSRCISGGGSGFCGQQASNKNQQVLIDCIPFP
jgi:hypothetical protein